MKITIVQGPYFPVPPLIGGAVEKIWYRLGQEFAARGHAVTHLSRRYPGLPAENEEAGVHHQRVRGYGQPANALMLKVRDLLYTLRACRRLPPADITVTNTFFAPMLMHKRSGVYVDVERMPKGQMRCYRHAARLRANSAAVRAAILREVPEMASRTCVIPNPLPFVPDRPVAWEKKEQCILYVGRLHPEKGIGLLLEAFVRLKAAGNVRDWRLELVGPSETERGGGGKAWEADLRRRFAHPDIAWLDPIYDQARLNQCYERASVFAYPSLAERGETFGLAPLEAMAWGAIPVVSRLACFNDFIMDRVNGLVFDHRAAMPVQDLIRCFQEACGGDVRVLAENASRVRMTHAPGRIAEGFLEDFALICEK